MILLCICVCNYLYFDSHLNFRSLRTWGYQDCRESESASNRKVLLEVGLWEEYFLLHIYTPKPLICSWAPPKHQSIFSQGISHISDHWKVLQHKHADDRFRKWSGTQGTFLLLFFVCVCEPSPSPSSLRASLRFLWCPSCSPQVFSRPEESENSRSTGCSSFAIHLKGQSTTSRGASLFRKLP